MAESLDETDAPTDTPAEPPPVTGGALGEVAVPAARKRDWIGLVGDPADGIPGIPGWGPKSSSLLLGRYRHVEAIPEDAMLWGVKVQGAKRLAANLRSHRKEAELYRLLATLRTDVPLSEDLEDLHWRGARREQLEALCQELGDRRLLDQVHGWLD